MSTSRCLSCVYATALLLVLFPVGVRAQVVINEVAAATRFSFLDDEEDRSDWLELYNSGDAAALLTGWTLSDDPAEPTKWVLPEFSLPPLSHLVVWCSGKDRTETVEGAVTSPKLLLPFEPGVMLADAPWRYLVQVPENAEPPTGWTDPAFDDTAWMEGALPLGYGEEGLGTEVAKEAGVVLLRRRFEVEDPLAIGHLTMRADFDDSIVLYLNGTRIFSENFPPDEIPRFDSFAQGGLRESGKIERFDLSASTNLLQAGENTLAVALINVRGTATSRSRDLFVWLELGAVPPVWHTNFSISEDGETLVLSDSSGVVQDMMSVPGQQQDRTYGRAPDGAAQVVYLYVPTPRRANDSHTSDAVFPALVQPTVLPPAGKQSGPVDVTVSVDVPFADVEIRYTVDGSAPTGSSGGASLVYEGPIHVEEDTVLRAAGFLDSGRATQVVSRSYYGLSEGTRDLDLPVFSISLDPESFQTVQTDSDARGRGAERPAFLEIFDADGMPEVATGFGLRIHGGAGRQGDFARKKAYRTYFRSIYGDGRLRYPLFEDSTVEDFDTLILRSNFNDGLHQAPKAVLIRDQVIRELNRDMGELISHGTWYSLLINMEFRGVYNVVERIDSDYLESYFPDQGKEWDVIRQQNEVLNGTGEAWDQMRAFFDTGDLSDDTVYEEAKRLIDVENFARYMLTNIWSQNHDWPINNWYAARSRDAGKWMFFTWDAEFGFGMSPEGFDTDTFDHALTAGGPFPPMLRALLWNPQFQTLMLAELDRHLTGVLAPDRVLARIAAAADVIRPDIPEETNRVGGSLEQWTENLGRVEEFARQRGSIIRNFFVNSGRFGLPLAPEFRRGDVTADGRTNVLDAIVGLRYLSGVDVGAFCVDAFDSNDSGAVDLTDALLVLNFIFAPGSPAPAAPFPGCGPDVGSDSQGCDGPTLCP